MAAGKTTVGKELAVRFGMKFIDLDWYIETRYHKTIGELFSLWGEDKFREIESKLLKEVGEFEDVIISTGGGTPCFFDNIIYMNKVGTTIYLRADAETLTKRLSLNRDKRPLVKDKTETELLNYITINLEKREPFYLQATHIYETGDVISTDFNQFIDEMINSLKLYPYAK